MNTFVRSAFGGSIALRIAFYYGVLLAAVISSLLLVWLYGLPLIGLQGARDIKLAEAIHALEVGADSRQDWIEASLRERRHDARQLAEDAGLERALTALAKAAPGAEEVMKETGGRILSSAMRAHPDATLRLLVVSLQGRIEALSESGKAAGTRSALVGTVFGDTRLLARATTSGIGESLEIAPCPDARTACVIIARQIAARDAAGNPTGVVLGALLAYVPAPALLGSFGRTEFGALGSTGSVLLFDDEGRVMASFDRRSANQEAITSVMPPRGKGMEGNFMESGSSGQAVVATYRFIAIANAKGWTLAVRRDRDEIDASLYQLARRLLFFGMLVGLGGLLLVSVAAWHLTRPLKDLLRSAQGLAAGDLKSRATPDTSGGRNELTALAESFNTMAERVEDWHTTLHEEVEERTRDLENYRKNLEALVDKRTAALSQALAAAKTAELTKDQFLANISHELRTPLNAVIGFSALAHRHASDAKQADYLDKITEAGKNLSGIINDLLDLSRIAAGKLHFESIPFGLRQLVEHSIATLSGKAAEKNLDISCLIDESTDDTFLGDPLRIEQILLNLLSNAVKFTPAGKIEIRARQIARAEQRVKLEIAVSDTGIGIDETALSDLFKPFGQGDITIPRKHGGSGLGLSICRQLAQLMDGEIKVSSAVGSGSTFTFTVWLGIAPPTAWIGEEGEDGEVGAAPGKATVPRYRDTRVLVVEDQAFNREIVCALLGDIGISATTAGNGREALDLLYSTADTKAPPFDLIFMDIQMPVLDGLQATRELRNRAEFRDLPVLALSAHTMAHEEATWREAGLNDHLGKPFDTADFYRMLEKWLPENKRAG